MAEDISVCLAAIEHIQRKLCEPRSSTAQAPHEHSVRGFSAVRAFFRQYVLPTSKGDKIVYLFGESNPRIT